MNFVIIHYIEIVLSKRQIHLIYLLASEYSWNYKQKTSRSQDWKNCSGKDLRESLSCCMCDWSKAACAFKIITKVFATGLPSRWCCNSFKCLVCFSSKRNREEAFLHLHDNTLVESKCLLRLAVVNGVCVVPPWLLGSSVPGTLVRLLFRHENLPVLVTLHATP